MNIIIHPLKTIYHFITGILLALLAFHSGMAQNGEIKFSNDSVEKNFYKNMYIVNYQKHTNLRAANSQTFSVSIYSKIKVHFTAAGGCYYLKETTPLADVIRKTISKEKIKSLAFNDLNRLFIVFIYDMNTGQVVDLHFILRGVPLSDDINSKTEITLRDIYRLETVLKEYRFDIPKGCVNPEANPNNPAAHYGNWAMPFTFSKLAEEEKETK